MKVMEAREEVDSATNAEQLQELQQDNLQQQDACLQVGADVSRSDATYQ